MTDSQHPNIDRLLEGTTPPITPWEQISEAIRTCVPDGDLGMVLRLMHDETRAQGERLAPELRAILADNERLTAQVADTRAKLAAAEKELDHRRGIRPCHRTAVHPGHLWMLDRKPVTCLGVKDAQPPAVAAPDAQDRAGRAQEAAGGSNVARDGAQRGQEGLAGSKAPTGTTQAATEAPAPPAAPDANEDGR